MVAKKVISKRLVIDASVARSAGGEDATYPQSVHCREFLKTVLDICHQIVMTPDIKEEWDKHQSNFARKWRIQMVTKKKFQFLALLNPCMKIMLSNSKNLVETLHCNVSTPGFIPRFSNTQFFNLSINNELWNQIEKLAKTDKQRGEMVKDLHLIEAAIATDKIVISLDDNTARKFFSQASQKIDELKNIVWVNPDKIPEETPIDWLKKGALMENERMLINFCLD